MFCLAKQGNPQALALSLFLCGRFRPAVITSISADLFWLPQFDILYASDVLFFFFFFVSHICNTSLSLFLRKFGTNCFATNYVTVINRNDNDLFAWVDIPKPV